MKLSTQLAKHLRETHFGKNWTWSWLNEHLADVTWQQATTKIGEFNTIAALVFHINYYASAALKVLQGEELNAKDAYSFDHPPINSQRDWDSLLEKIWGETEQLATLIEALPESKLWETFSEDKYGNYYRNLHGIIEHTHYHLGQIVMLKKMLQVSEKAK